MGKQSVYILLFFLNLLIHNAYAYNLKQVADKEYMSNSSITSLCQDERGLMWIGTCDGLNIYDGQEIEEFKTRDKEDYLSGNLIDNIVYTGEDIYWIQTYYGLNRLNRKIKKVLLPFLIMFKERFPNKTIWCYTGFTLEEIMGKRANSRAFTPISSEMLSLIDVLVDGPYIEDKKDISLVFRGSSNQRIIDVKKSFKKQTVGALFG